MREVIWSYEAYVDYDKNIEYLLQEWTIESVVNFEYLVEEKLKQLQQMPWSVEATDIDHVRKAVIVKQVTLYYKITKERIELLRFWNSYKDPQGLRL